MAEQISQDDSLELEEVVDRLIARMMGALKEKKIRGTVADLIRARQLRDEWDPPSPPVVQVTWIDGWE